MYAYVTAELALVRSLPDRLVLVTVLLCGTIVSVASPIQYLASH